MTRRSTATNCACSPHEDFSFEILMSRYFKCYRVAVAVAVLVPSVASIWKATENLEKKGVAVSSVAEPEPKP